MNTDKRHRMTINHARFLDGGLKTHGEKNQETRGT